MYLRMRWVGEAVHRNGRWSIHRLPIMGACRSHVSAPRTEAHHGSASPNDNPNSCHLLSQNTKVADTFFFWRLCVQQFLVGAREKLLGYGRISQWLLGHGYCAPRNVSYLLRHFCCHSASGSSGYSPPRPSRKRGSPNERLPAG